MPATGDVQRPRRRCSFCSAAICASAAATRARAPAISSRPRAGAQPRDRFGGGARRARAPRARAPPPRRAASPHRRAACASRRSTAAAPRSAEDPAMAACSSDSAAAHVGLRRLGLRPAWRMSSARAPGLQQPERGDRLIAVGFRAAQRQFAYRRYRAGRSSAPAATRSPFRDGDLDQPAADLRRHPHVGGLDVARGARRAFRGAAAARRRSRARAAIATQRDRARRSMHHHARPSFQRHQRDALHVRHHFVARHHGDAAARRRARAGREAVRWRRTGAAVRRCRHARAAD